MGQADVPAADYLSAYVANLSSGSVVDFAPHRPPRRVAVHPDRVVLGLANAWASGSGTGGGLTRALYLRPQQLAEAWDRLERAGLAPRGAMFWTVGNEGARPGGDSPPLPVYLAALLNQFMVDLADQWRCPAAAGGGGGGRRRVVPARGCLPRVTALTGRPAAAGRMTPA